MSFEHDKCHESLVPDGIIDLPRFNGVRSALISNRVPKLYAASPLSFHRRVGDDVMGFGHVAPNEFIDEVLKLGVQDERMRDFEIEHAKAFRPFELNDPLKLHSNLFEYYNEPELDYDDKLLTQCFNEVIDELRSAKSFKLLRPLTLDESFKLIPSGTNSGLPFYTSSHWTNEMVLDYKSRAYLVQQGDPSVLYPYIMQLRLQPKQDSVSHRVVWNPDKAELIAAKTITQPTLELMQELPYYRGYLGPHEMPPVMELMFKFYDTYLSLDFSGFDKTVHKMQMNKLRLALLRLWGMEYEPEINALFHYYINGPILFANEQKKLRQLNGAHGVPSGVGATFLTSLINRANWKYVAKRQNFSDEDWFHLANGDDTAVALRNVKVNLQAISDEFAKLGLKVSTDERKSHLTFKGEKPYMVFLSRYYFEDDCNGVFPLTKAALTLYFQERYKTPEMTLTSLGFDQDVAGGTQIVRQSDLIGVIQRMENCKFHKSFDKFVNYVQFTTPTYIDPVLWDNQYTEQIAKNKSIRTGRGSTVHGLRSFKTVSIINETSRNLNNDLFGLYLSHVDHKGSDVKDFPLSFTKPTITKQVINMTNQIMTEATTDESINNVEEMAPSMTCPPTVDELKAELAKEQDDAKRLADSISLVEDEVSLIKGELSLAEAKLSSLIATKNASLELQQAITKELEELTAVPLSEVDQLKKMVMEMAKEIESLRTNKPPKVEETPVVTKPVKRETPVMVERPKQVTTIEEALERPIIVESFVDDGTRLGKKKSELAAVMEQLTIEMGKSPRNKVEISRLSTERTQLASSINQMEKAKGGDKKSKSRKRADKQATRLAQQKQVESWLDANTENSNGAYYQTQLAKLASLISAIEASELSSDI